MKSRENIFPNKLILIKEKQGKILLLSPSAVFVEPIEAVRWVVAVVADKYINYFYCMIIYATLINATQLKEIVELDICL